MCRHCQADPGLFAEMEMEMYGSRSYFGGGFGDLFSGGDVNRGSFAPVSQRAMHALETAKTLFLSHLAQVDTSKGAVTTEIIQFHLVPDMRKKFNKYVKEYGCVGTSRQITRAEQDLVNKSRKSLLWYTSVKVTPQAQANYFAKNPNIPRPSATAVSASSSTPSAASGSSNASSASASGSSPNTSVSSAAAVRDLTAEKKARAKLNAAAVNYAASNASVKIMNSAKTG